MGGGEKGAGFPSLFFLFFFLPMGIGGFGTQHFMLLFSQNNKS